MIPAHFTEVKALRIFFQGKISVLIGIIYECRDYLFDTHSDISKSKILSSVLAN